MGYDFDNYLAEIPEKSLKHDAVKAINSNDISGFLSEAVVFGISRIQDTASLLLGIILVPIFLFFWLWDTDTLSKGFSNIVPRKRKFLSKVWNETNLNFQKLHNSIGLYILFLIRYYSFFDYHPH